MIKIDTISITASDVTGQRNVAARDIPVDRTVAQVVEGLLPRMHLNRLDRGGQPVQFDARLEREGRHLHRTELVGDALQPNDHLVLHPRIMAG